MDEKKATQYVFKFECAEDWETLTVTENENVRHCQRCGNNVHLVRNDKDFTANAEKGNCIYAIQTRTVGVIVPPERLEELKVQKDSETEKPDKVGAIPIFYRLIQLVLFFIAALPLVAFLPLYIQRVMTRSQTSGGDIINHGWKFRTLYGYIADFNYFRPEENFSFFLAINLLLACVYAFIIAFVIVLFIIGRKPARVKFGKLQH